MAVDCMTKELDEYLHFISKKHGSVISCPVPVDLGIPEEAQR